MNMKCRKTNRVVTILLIVSSLVLCMSACRKNNNEIAETNTAVQETTEYVFKEYDSDVDVLDDLENDQRENIETTDPENETVAATEEIKTDQDNVANENETTPEPTQETMEDQKESSESAGSFTPDTYIPKDETEMDVNVNAM